MDKRRAKSLGPKSKLSKRQAKVMCDRLAVELQISPAYVASGKAPCLGEYLERYLASRTDLRPGTLELHKLTQKYLFDYFGPDIRIDKISRKVAAD